MKVLVLGGDGYLGWPTAMRFANNGHEVVVADNYMRRKMCEMMDSEPLIDAPSLTIKSELFFDITGSKIIVRIGDLAEADFMFSLVSEYKPDVIVHYAEQPSAPYSMRGFKEAQQPFNNNLNVTFNCIWAMISHAPNAHLIKLGTMGEYGTPNIDIEEGWIDIEHNGRSDKFLFPRAAGSLYHTTKVLDTDLLWFYVRNYKLRVTDRMQGPVYGIKTAESVLDSRLTPSFNYDDIFGTVVNRFLIQAVSGIPLTVYGQGGQTRGYINLRDTLQCVELASKNTPLNGVMEIYNQFTETFTVNELALKVQSAARTLNIKATIKNIDNPRLEKEDHYYNPKHSKLSDLGLAPSLMTDDELASIMEFIKSQAKNIRSERIMPRVSWNKL